MYDKIAMNNDETVNSGTEEVNNYNVSIMNSDEIVNNDKKTMNSCNDTNSKSDTKKTRKNREDHNEEQIQIIVELMKKGYPKELIKKLSGFSENKFNKYFVIVMMNYRDVYEAWKPAFEVETLKKSYEIIKNKLLKHGNEKSSNIYVKIEDKDDGSVNVSLYNIDSNKQN